VPLPKVPLISIIDDDASVRSAVSRLIRATGYLAHAFPSAADFLNSQHLRDTSCVIADVQMPGMSGIELQNLLHARGYSMPMIFITAFPDENSRVQAIQAGAVAFLSKPFDATTLVDTIDSALQKGGG
jgi:FixJ family two-component response regulator